MNKFCVDSSVWIAYIRGESEKFRDYIEKNDLVCSPLAFLEIADKCFREGMKEQEVRGILHFMTAKADVINLTLNLSIQAAKIKKEQRESKKKFGIVDGVHYATAIQEKSILLTKDKDFLGLVNTKIVG